MRRTTAADPTLGGSYRNLQALVEGSYGGGTDLDAGGPLAFTSARANLSRSSLDSGGTRKPRFILVTNHLPVKASRESEDMDWSFELDVDALVVQAKEGIDEEYQIMYVGSLSVEIDPMDQDVVAKELKQLDCYPVFLGKHLKERYYKGFCKQQLWPLFHYLLPLSPTSTCRFDPDLWQAYVKANKTFADKLVEIVSMEDDYVWIHDYHLLVLPSLLRKRLFRVRCGLFLHSPFPSSEVFRTFPKRDELLRSILNVDLVGFHTFDYARHFLSCCSRMLGVEHVTSRGSIMLEYYGRNVGVKIMPTGVQPRRLLDILQSDDCKWRRGELQAQFRGQTVLIGVDDMDLFKGIELKLQALERVLDHHAEWRGRLVLVQVTNPPRGSGKDIAELHQFCMELVDSINAKYGDGDYQPVVWLERPVPLYERCALYSIADCAVVTATRDGMNLVPYEYVVCRQGVPGDDDSDEQTSMVVVSEFVGCSPSVSGAIRVNPWSIDAVADGIYKAIKMQRAERHLRHEKHWRYISQHTVRYWTESFTTDLQRFTKDHGKMKCYGLGLGLDSFKMVALTENFRKLEPLALLNAYSRASRRLFMLDYDGTLLAQSSINPKPGEDVLAVLRALTADESNTVFIVSGRGRAELGAWFQSVENLGLAAEHGFYYRAPGMAEWEARFGEADEHAGWKEIALPILQLYTESTDGSYVEAKDSALVWHYRDTDPDFGQWQAKELLDHMEGVLSNEPVEVVSGNTIVEVKPQGVSKGGMVDRVLGDASDHGGVPDFVLCIGDDRSDEDMFLAIEHVTFSPHMPAEVFACTVGQKPSKAPYYVNDPEDVLFTLARLGEASALQNGGSPPALPRFAPRAPGGSAAGSAPPSPPALRGVL